MTGRKSICIKDWSTITLNAVMILSIAATAIWVVFEFFIKNDDLINRKPFLTSDITLNQVVIDNKYFIKASVNITNTGNDLVEIKFPHPPLTTYLVSHVDKKLNHIKKQVINHKSYDYTGKTLGTTDTSNLLISQNTSFRLSFLAPIKESGIYYVLFNAIQKHEHFKEILRKKGYPPITELSMQSGDYITINIQP